MGANWGSRLEMTNTGHSTLDAYHITLAKHDDNILNWFQMAGKGIISPVTNIIQDCEASPPPKASKIIGDVAAAVVFVTVIVSSAADFGESLAVLGAIIEAGEGADIALGAALGIGEKAVEDAAEKAASEVTSLFGQIKFTLTNASVQDYAEAIAIVGEVTNLGAEWSQMSPITADDPAKSFANAVFEGLSIFVSVYGSLEQQLAVNVALVATSEDAKNPAKYLEAIGSSVNLADSVFGRELKIQEKLALRASSAFIGTAFVAANRSSTPNDYISAIVNSFGGSAASFALANVAAEFSQAPGTPDPSSMMTQMTMAGGESNIMTATIMENQPWNGDSLRVFLALTLIITYYPLTHLSILLCTYPAGKVGTIVSAAWGSDKQAYVVGNVVDTGIEDFTPIYYDVTSKVQGLVVNGSLMFAPSVTNMGYDPARGEQKTLYLTYMPPTNTGCIVNDGAFSFAIRTNETTDNPRVWTFNEGDTIEHIDFGTIVTATYGSGGQYLDVSALMIGAHTQRRRRWRDAM